MFVCWLDAPQPALLARCVLPCQAAALVSLHVEHAPPAAVC